MKKLQCRECELVFWTELDLIGNQVIGSEEWVHVECPKCGEEWAIYEPGKKKKAGAIVAAAKRRKAKRKAVPARRKKLALEKSLQAGKATPFAPARIRSLRKKLGISQRQLGKLTGVSVSAVAMWEKGKYIPKKDKILKLESLNGLKKDDVQKMLGGREAEAA
jgi:DNA-binding transcriptional regulator YiaG